MLFSYCAVVLLPCRRARRPYVCLSGDSITSVPLSLVPDATASYNRSASMEFVHPYLATQQFCMDLACCPTAEVVTRQPCRKLLTRVQHQHHLRPQKQDNSRSRRRARARWGVRTLSIRSYKQRLSAVLSGTQAMRNRPHCHHRDR